MKVSMILNIHCQRKSTLLSLPIFCVGNLYCEPIDQSMITSCKYCSRKDAIPACLTTPQGSHYYIHSLATPRLVYLSNTMFQPYNGFTQTNYQQLHSKPRFPLYIIIGRCYWQLLFVNFHFLGLVLRMNVSPKLIFVKYLPTRQLPVADSVNYKVNILVASICANLNLH